MEAAEEGSAQEALQEGRLIRDAHDGAINCIHTSVNSKLLATGSRDKTAKVSHLGYKPYLALWNL